MRHILAPVSDAADGFLSGGKEKRTAALRPNLFTQIRATKPGRILVEYL